MYFKITLGRGKIVWRKKIPQSRAAGMEYYPTVYMYILIWDMLLPCLQIRNTWNSTKLPRIWVTVKKAVQGYIIMLKSYNK